MAELEQRLASVVGVVQTLRNSLEQYQIPDREYLSVNICKRCEVDIISCSNQVYYSDPHYGVVLDTFMGMPVNRNIPPTHCIICRGHNG